ncbi:hypothetical protein BX600DRAFT_440142 [Xylariales sp. PMI_506]|nr:hypothetical protein BX600DRAFT_440142 [Xylariales sp. PMI_506]
MAVTEEPPVTPWPELVPRSSISLSESVSSNNLPKSGASRRQEDPQAANPLPPLEVLREHFSSNPGRGKKCRVTVVNDSPLANTSYRLQCLLSCVEDQISPGIVLRREPGAIQGADMKSVVHIQHLAPSPFPASARQTLKFSPASVFETKREVILQRNSTIIRHTSNIAPALNELSETRGFILKNNSSYEKSKAESIAMTNKELLYETTYQPEGEMDLGILATHCSRPVRSENEKQQDSRSLHKVAKRTAEEIEEEPLHKRRKDSL